MKAILVKKYGDPKQVARIAEIAKPTPKANEVLIKIHCTTINDYDWGLVTGKPYIYRPLFGWLKPKNPIPGMELSGTVEAVGAAVQTLKAGDAVYGDISNYGFGTFAEYICINEKAVVLKPTALSFEEAAAIPHAALLALQALQYKGKISEGQQILINGGGGGVGTFGFQLAKNMHCHITGVDSGDKLEMMLSMGYDKVIDYTKEDFTKNGEQYDLVLDCKTNRSAFAYARSLKPTGKYITIGGKPGSLINVTIIGKLISLFSKKKLQVLMLRSNEGLDYITDLYQQQKLKCTIDGPYTLSDILQLIQYFGEGKHKGKIVVKIC